jgi:fatty acid kinase
VSVVRSRSQQAGLTAALALDPKRGAEANRAAMEQALDQVRTGGVARAARDDGQARFAAGEAVGYVDEELVAWGGPESTLGVVLGKLANDAELLTCIEGDGAPLSAASVRRLVPDGVELELSEGGQPSWWWLISAE